MSRPVDRGGLHDDGAAAQGEPAKRLEGVPLAQRVALRDLVELRRHRRADDDGAADLRFHRGLDDGHVRGAVGLACCFHITG